jgi:hypothetical protein
VSQVARILAAELERASILAPPGRKSALDSLASGTPRDGDAFLEALSENALAALAWLFEFWALPHQQPAGGRLADMGRPGRTRRGQDAGGCRMGAGAGGGRGPGGCGHARAWR